MPQNTAIVGDTEAILTLLFGAPQHDAHMKKWRWFKYAYGGNHARYVRMQAEDQERARLARIELVKTADGREFLQRCRKANREWAESRGQTYKESGDDE